MPDSFLYFLQVVENESVFSRISHKKPQVVHKILYHISVEHFYFFFSKTVYENHTFCRLEV